MRIRRILHFLLVTLAVILLWQIGATWRRPLPMPLLPAPPPQDNALVVASTQALTLEAVESEIESIKQNNLFAPNRGREAPANPEGETRPAVPPPSHLKLVGVVLSRVRAEALFADSSQGGKVVRVRQGDTVGSYQLARVTPAEVKLTLGPGGEEVSVPLLILDSAQAGQAPRLLPAVAQAGRSPVRPGVAQAVPPPTAVSAQGEVLASPPQEEAQALRENIQQLQQRLRRVRRRAAREEARARGGEEGNEGENGEEDEDE